MRILILGKHRSRSNYVLDIISSYYGIRNLFEPYRPIYEKFLYPNEWWNHAENEILPEGFITEVKNKTNELIEIDNIALKLEITHLTSFPYDGQLINFDFFKLNFYDKIFVTTRNNLVDTVASLCVAHMYDSWLYNENNLPFEDIEKFSFDMSNEFHKKSIFTAIWDNHVLDLIYDYMNANSIGYTTLTYENVPEYIKKNFPSGSSRYIESNYDYKSLIKNYDDIELYIKEFEPRVLRLFELKN